MTVSTHWLQEKQELRIPGPTPVPPSVLRAMSRPMINHRGPEFKAILARVTERLQRLVGTEQYVAILTGSGTAGMEAACANLVSPGDRVLVLEGGVFGHRWVEIATAFGAQVEVMEYPWHTGVDPQQLGERLRETPGVRAIFTTHNESSTGVLNDLQAIARVRDQVAPDALVVVDSVSGLGGAPLSMDAWGLDAVVSASQKCIMAPPGLAFVALSRRAWQRAETSRASRYYLDLAAHRRMFEKGQTPWTPAVSVVYAVDEALDLMAREAPEERFARHRLMRDMVRAGLEADGWELMVEDRFASPTVTAVRPPAGVDVEAVRRVALQELGVVFSGGQGRLAGQILRVGHMGFATPLDMINAVAAAEMALARTGAPVSAPGKGVAAAQAVWLERQGARP
ncbi:alanine--glyoxylate aminotransferase family protein [Carboxydochorda subterranea]|uniref:Alanine--glyoxylate aminotransferase family protein n=1 Tax=Carboxydichorda subterranea TaxID=3109565 RepID=A0ABZ1BWC2_9FIRM|nr:alanine--glyoxylate aminotransferase family protein [Limnochorda sp. L945t]WRP16408.1 alanine--glyoxylate aminotransferase family protein [Limnochorda sp. L945t]